MSLQQETGIILSDKSIRLLYADNDLNGAGSGISQRSGQMFQSVDFAHFGKALTYEDSLSLSKRCLREIVVPLIENGHSAQFTIGRKIGDVAKKFAKRTHIIVVWSFDSDKQLFTISDSNNKMPTEVSFESLATAWLSEETNKWWVKDKKFRLSARVSVSKTKNRTAYTLPLEEALVSLDVDGFVKKLLSEAARIKGEVVNLNHPQEAYRECFNWMNISNNLDPGSRRSKSSKEYHVDVLSVAMRTALSSAALDAAIESGNPRPIPVVLLRIDEDIKLAAVTGYRGGFLSENGEFHVIDEFAGSLARSGRPFRPDLCFPHAGQ